MDIAWSPSAGATSYEVQRSADGSGGWTTVASPGTNAYADTSLEASTSYYYRVAAIGPAGSSSYSSTTSATTGSVTVPGVPAGLVASPNGPTEVDLSWGAAAGAASYTVQRSPDGSTGWMTVGTPAGPGFANAGLAASTPYYYRVSATNAAGTSAYSTIATETTGNAAVPMSPAGLTASSVILTSPKQTSPNQVVMSWTDRSARSAAGYTVERSADGVTGWAAIATVTAPTASAADSGLSPATTYHYRVKATNAAGGSGYSNVHAATTASAAVPGSPAGLTAVPTASSAVYLSWPLAANADTYALEQSPHGANTWTTPPFFYPPSDPIDNYSVGGLTPGSSYDFRVTASNATGAGSPSPVATATMPAVPTGYPTAPATLTAVPSGPTSVTLTWSNDATHAIAFEVNRNLYGAEGQVPVYPLVGVAPGDVLTYTDTGLSPSTLYVYNIKAVNDRGLSYATADVKVATLAAAVPPAPTNLAATPLGANTVALAWDDDSSVETAYLPQRAPHGTGTWTTLATLPPGSTTYTDATAASGTAYDYRVGVTNAAGTATSPAVRATTPPATAPTAPSSLTAPTIGSGSVTLSWTGGGAGDGVSVERAGDDGAGNPTVWGVVGTIASGSASFLDGGLLPSTAYHYRVRVASLANGNSSYSNAVAATTTALSAGTYSQGTYRAPTGLAVSVLGPTTALVSYASNDSGGNLSGAYVETSADGSTGWSQVASGQYSPVTITGLTAGSTHYFRSHGHRFGVVATDYSNTVGSTTWPADYAIPAVPSNLAAATSPGVVHLTWTDDGSAVTIVERTDDGRTWHEVGRAPIGATSYDDTDPGLFPGFEYGYAVRAIGLGGVSASTAARPAGVSPHDDPTVVKVTMAAAAPAVFAAVPTNVAAYPGSDTKAWVAWDVNDEDPLETGFAIQLSTDGGSTWGTARASVPARWSACYVSGLAASTNYLFRVASVNGHGTSAYSSPSGSITTLAAGQVWSPTGRIPKFILNPEWYAGMKAGLDDFISWCGYTSYSAWVAAGRPVPGDPQDGPSTWAGQVVGRLMLDAGNSLTINERYEQFPDRCSIAYQVTGDPYYANLAYGYFDIGNAPQGQPPFLLYTGTVTGSASQVVTTRTDLEVAPFAFTNDSNSLKFVKSASQPFQASETDMYLDVTGGAGWTPGRYWMKGLNGPYMALGHSPGANGITGGTGVVSSTTFAASGLSSFPGILQYQGGLRVWFDTGANVNLALVGQYRAFAWTPGTSTITIIPGTPHLPAVGDTFTGVDMNGWDGNLVRNRFTELCLNYDWMYQGIAAAKRQRLLQFLNMLADLSLGHNTGNGASGLALGADQGLGTYFGLVMLAQTGDLGNPRAASLLTEVADPDCQQANTQVGGLTPTQPSSTNNARNEMLSYALRASSGEWIQSSEYNQDNPSLPLMGTMALRTALDTEHFPEYALFFPRLAAWCLHRLTADLRAAPSWGDDEHPDTLNQFDNLSSVASYGGICQRFKPIGPRLVNAYFTYWYQSGQSADPRYIGARSYSGKVYAFIDFRSTGTDYRASPAAWAGPGAHQSLFAHADWHDDTSAFFWSGMFSCGAAQHEVEWLGNWECWFRQTRALTHANGYTAGFLLREAGVNGLAINGIDSPHEIRGRIASDIGPSGEYAYQVGSTYGLYNDTQNGVAQPPRATHERTRSVVFLPARVTGTSATVVLYERTQAQRADLLSGYDVYNVQGTDTQSRIATMAALEQMVCQVAVAPTGTGNRVSWTVPPGSSYATGLATPEAAHPGVGGFPAHIDTLLPANALRSVEGPSEWGADAVDIFPAEVKYRVRIYPNPPLPPTSLPRSTRFLQVYQAHDAGVTAANTLVQSSAGEAADGALVRRAGEPDVVLFFGSKPLDRTFRSGFSAGWTSAATATFVYVFDLDKDKSWTSNLDGAGAVALTPTAAGVGRVAVAGAGPHTLTLAGS